jgi:cell wall assembly regulator SMI1
MATLYERFTILHPSAHFGRGASAAEVADAEQMLGVSFPATLRSYLMEFGYLEIDSSEMYGLGAGVPSYLNLVKNTIDERTILHPNIPVRFLPLLNNGCGDHYCVDMCSGTPDPPVVFWSHELGSDQTPQLVAKTFSEWLLDGLSD